jgi:hypothetical protein
MMVEGSEKHYQWIYNVLEKTAEVERIVYEDPDPVTGFMILPNITYHEGGKVLFSYEIQIFSKIFIIWFYAKTGAFVH